MSYSYSPNDLLTSFERLKGTEEELLERASGDAPMTIVPTASSTTPPLSSKNSDNIIVVAATQLTGTGLPDSDVSGFCFRAETAIEQAAQAGATVILLPELWAGPYFCQSQQANLMGLALPLERNVLIKRMQLLAKLYGVILPISFYERQNNVLFNSIVVIDTDGSLVPGISSNHASSGSNGPATVYRKTHIPDGTGYQEKFYFSPGDTGFKVFPTSLCNIGVAICWDQWFPEAARSMALMGADLLLYPTAIGSEPQDPTWNSSRHWQRVMQGHAAANMIPVVASNRFGTEILLRDQDGTEQQRINFYGKSFITDITGDIVVEASDNRINQPVVVITAEIDKERNRRERAAWGMFRDRRPDVYGVLLTKDGGVKP